jgi:catechol 2,3-dioxygenase-like lactoylglutathione lyase family enzyme
MEIEMSSVQDRGDPAADPAGLETTDLKLEVVVIPVSDVDRAKAFYGGLGWRLDADFADDHGFRIVQLTPHGSACSIQFGSKLTSAPPGSATNVYLVVPDVQAARDAIAALGVAVSEVFHERSIGDRFNPDARVAGPAPDGATYGSFASFSDPDGNSWLLQELTVRLAGRVHLLDAPHLADRLLETSLRHEAFDTAAPKHNWWDWYAAYMDAREHGNTPDESSALANTYMAEVKGIVVPTDKTT